MQKKVYDPEREVIVKIVGSESLIGEVTALLESRFYPLKKTGLIPNHIEDTGEYHRFMTLTHKEVKNRDE